MVPNSLSRTLPKSTQQILFKASSGAGSGWWSISPDTACSVCGSRISMYPRGDRPPRRRRRRPVLPPGGGLASDPARVSGAGGRAGESGVRPDRGRDTRCRADERQYKCTADLVVLASDGGLQTPRPTSRPVAGGAVRARHAHQARLSRTMRVGAAAPGAQGVGVCVVPRRAAPLRRRWRAPVAGGVRTSCVEGGLAGVAAAGRSVKMPSRIAAPVQ